MKKILTLFILSFLVSNSFWFIKLKPINYNNIEEYIGSSNYITPTEFKLNKDSILFKNKKIYIESPIDLSDYRIVKAATAGNNLFLEIYNSKGAYNVIIWNLLKQKAKIYPVDKQYDQGTCYMWPCEHPISSFYVKNNHLAYAFVYTSNNTTKLYAWIDGKIETKKIPIKKIGEAKLDTANIINVWIVNNNYYALFKVTRCTKHHMREISIICDNKAYEFYILSDNATLINKFNSIKDKLKTANQIWFINNWKDIEIYFIETKENRDTFECNYKICFGNWECIFDNRLKTSIDEIWWWCIMPSVKFDKKLKSTIISINDIDWNSKTFKVVWILDYLDPKKIDEMKTYIEKYYLKKLIRLTPSKKAFILKKIDTLYDKVWNWNYSREYKSTVLNLLTALKEILGK